MSTHDTAQGHRLGMPDDLADRWTSAAVELPGAVQHTLTVGDAPTDQWHVQVALPPANLPAGPGPFPALYLVDGFMTFIVAAQIAQTTLAFPLDPADRGLGAFHWAGCSPAGPC